MRTNPYPDPNIRGETACIKLISMHQLGNYPIIYIVFLKPENDKDLFFKWIASQNYEAFTLNQVNHYLFQKQIKPQSRWNSLA